MATSNTELKENQLEEARDYLIKAYDLIKEATTGARCEHNVKAYTLDHLKIAISEDHGFLSNDQNIDSIIGMLREEEYEQERQEFEEDQYEKQLAREARADRLHDERLRR